MQKTTKSLIKSFIKSFGFAISGVRFLSSERNSRIHIIAATLVTISGLYFEISRMEWCTIAITIGMVMTAEAFNSAIEQVCNRITLDQDLHIKKIKDISAGAVLIIAVVALIIGLIIFLPKII